MRRVDLDIEGGGANGYAAFVTRLRSHFSGASKKYVYVILQRRKGPQYYSRKVLHYWCTPMRLPGCLPRDHVERRCIRCGLRSVLYVTHVLSFPYLSLLTPRQTTINVDCKHTTTLT